MMDEHGELYSLADGLDFIVYRPTARNIRAHPNAGGPRVVRLGPKANGELQQRTGAPKMMPPGTRKVAPRELIYFSQYPS